MDISTINWGFIRESILEEKAILFLGPGITYGFKVQSLQEEFYKKMIEENPNDILSYHKQDGFLIFNSHEAKVFSLKNIIKFYEQDFYHPILDKIAEIPFHMIISTTPDITLNNTFDQKQFRYNHQYYRTKIKYKIEEAITADYPLIYHLLGCIKDKNSLLTSHYDLFRLMESVYADKNLPDALTSAFHKDKTLRIIFLGFDFEKWYFQLLLYLLGIQYEDCKRFAAIQNGFSGEFKTLYESEFKINFVTAGIEEFVNKLHSLFDFDMLRKPSIDGKQVNRKYIKGNILKFLSKAFNSTQFETFCFINFEEVEAEFTTGQNQSIRLNLLLKYVIEHNELDRLLILAKEENPIQYKRFAPYYEE